MTTPSLFSFDFSDQAIKPGDIVRQAWPCVLCELGHALMPFWQVHHVHLDQLGERLYYCRPVPFTMGDGELHAFSEHDLERTGVSWRVPTYHEVQMWFVELGTTQFVAGLNGNRRTPQQTHPAEVELVKLLRPLGPLKIPAGESKFYTHFPSPTRQEWCERVLQGAL